MAVGPITTTLPLTQPLGLTPILPGEKTGEMVRPDGVSFADIFGQAVADANSMAKSADAAALALAEGRSDDIHGTMIEAKKASIQMQLVGNVKNKVVDAFYEIWRMSI